MIEDDKIATPQQPLANKVIWLRGLWMLIFMVLLGLAQTILGAAALIQFFWLLFTGRPNQPLAEFGTGLARWMAAAARFQTAASDEKPFPWAKWD